MKRIGVIGCGIMGSGIAELAARMGIAVVVQLLDDDAVGRGTQRIHAILDGGVKRGKLTEVERASALGQLTFTTRVEDLGDADLVIEAVPEIEALKVDVLGHLDEVISDRDVVIASNTSSIPIGRLARATMRPERVVGLHFFNPVRALALVELVRTTHTAEQYALRAQTFAKSLGKTVVPTADTPGFVVNALLIPYVLSGIRMLEAGVATAADIDTAMTLGCGHPMGPLALADLIGLDTVCAIAESLNRESGSPGQAPPALLLRMIESGRLGNKTGGGFLFPVG